MKPKTQYEEPQLFQSRLDQIINLKHPLCLLAQGIDWEYFEQKFGKCYIDQVGRPGIATRLMVSLHYLKHAYNESDESVVVRFLENPYWQYFAGLTYFAHQLPINPSSMTRWRQRIGEVGIDELLTVILNVAIDSGELKASSINHINVDTTVQEKAITYPIDGKLYYHMLLKLVGLAGDCDITLRQSYTRLSKAALIRQGRYAHAKQMKRSHREVKKLKIYLGRVYRDIKRQSEGADGALVEALAMAERLLNQSRNDKHKLYSLHAPEVECISKGKAHKRYEFGVKVGLASTAKDNWIIGIRTFPGNPYDGHTLQETMNNVAHHLRFEPRYVNVDQGYRKHDYQGNAEINIVSNRKMKQATRAERNWLKRRSAIEPIFGHLKSDNRMGRNYLKGAEGDHINAVLCASGYNMRKLLKVFFLPKFLSQILGQIFYKKLYLNPNRQNYAYFLCT